MVLLYSCGYSEVKENQTAVIAKMQEDEVVFTNSKELIAQLESELKKTKELDIKITNVAIDYSKAVDDEKVAIIQLIGSNDDSSVQISYHLKKVNDEFSIVSKSSTLVCEGCRSGCSPRRKTNGDGYCTKCDYSGASKCVKTETVPSYTE